MADRDRLAALLHREGIDCRLDYRGDRDCDGRIETHAPLADTLIAAGVGFPDARLRDALDAALIGMVRTSWPMQRDAYERGWNEAIHAAREKVRAALGEEPTP